MRAIRVLSVQHYPVFGGPHNEILQLDAELRRHGVETVVAQTDEAGTARERLEGRVPLHLLRLNRVRLSLNPWLHARFGRDFAGDVRRLRRLIRDTKPSLVKVHGPHNPHGAVAASLEGVPVVWVISSTRVPPAFRRLGMLFVRRLADAVLVNGAALLDAYPGGRGLSDRAFVYYPPVDTGIFVPSNPEERAATRVQLGVPADAFLVATVANLNPQKGIEYFVRAARIVAERVPTARFVVVGGTYDTHRRYAERMEAEARAAGLLPERLRFLGSRDDVSRILGAVDIKVITSVPGSEGTTTTAGEAMACGAPVVATRVGAVAEVVEDRVTGFVVPPLNPPAVADRVLRLWADADLRARMGLAARRRVEERFATSHHCGATHVRAYDFALQHRRSRGPLAGHDPMPSRTSATA